MPVRCDVGLPLNMTTLAVIAAGGSDETRARLIGAAAEHEANVWQIGATVHTCINAWLSHSIHTHRNTHRHTHIHTQTHPDTHTEALQPPRDSPV
jgi:hypothetical protein